MPRSGKEARDRLRRAALELYAAQGYDGTTTAEIAATARVNHRTFFRHFRDKREVLFGGEDDARETFKHDVVSARADLTPNQVLLHVFQQSAAALQEDAGSAIARLRIIAANPSLRERDLAKGAMLTETLASALRHRGVSTEIATLIAAMGWAAFQQASTYWANDPSQTLGHHLRVAFRHLEEAALTFQPPVETG
ncbi:TetR/AcrR family transcriptional regulator [Rhodococcoides yunnanense]|uniref:TetR/AcrR family transcriptional regulator n=1 Tax=Rhodococcoides yunnanense TaxID=278209 RepID=A0ABU4BIE7_9NOCA|nr:TetR/AcrR family transcriptional regulator [Rhodococcus yunnanensis]MDV6263971.1 TetR/AcrR family transcriptional regulator [Rhodococcus yunnanensis]